MAAMLRQRCGRSLHPFAPASLFPHVVSLFGSYPVQLYLLLLLRVHACGRGEGTGVAGALLPLAEEAKLP